jgi:hypothetical protein
MTLPDERLADMSCSNPEHDGELYSRISNLEAELRAEREKLRIQSEAAGDYERQATQEFERAEEAETQLREAREQLYTAEELITKMGLDDEYSAALAKARQ